MEESAATTSSSPSLKPLTSTISRSAACRRLLCLDRARNRRVEAGELREPAAPLDAEPVDELAILLGRVVGAGIVLCEVEPGDRLRDLVAPVRVLLPLDPLFRDLLHDFRRDPDRDLLAGRSVVRPDGPGVQDVRLHVRVGA